MNQRNALSRIVCGVVLATLLVVGCSDEVIEREGVGIGEVKRVDYEHKMITVNHDRIPEFMEALTMAYRVEDTKLLDAAKVGDSIKFTLNETKPGDLYITSITRLDITGRSDTLTIDTVSKLK